MDWENFIQNAGDKLLDARISQQSQPTTQVAPNGTMYREGQPASGAFGMSRNTLLIVGAVVALSAFMLLASRKG